MRLLRFACTITAFALLTAPLLVSEPARANELRGVIKNNAGVRKFGSKNGAQAFEDFTGALSDLPFSGEVHFNIGNSFLLRREYEKAISEYGIAAKSAPGGSSREKETRFRALFNSAIALTELKKIDEALASYQRALEIYPDSLETKTNIELLTAGGGGDGGDDKDEKKDKDGKGKGQDKDDKDKKDDKGDKKKDEPQKFENPRSTPKPFKSDELSQQDVKRILEELKRQESQIRARMQNEQRKDAPPDKDW